MTEAAYDRLGRGYASTRRTDPRIAARIEAALGDARSVLMIAQRPPGAAPVARGSAESLPDLQSGAWERRYGHLRKEPELDVGLRPVASELR